VTGSDALETVRLDRWLWAARFFKTRSQSATAIRGGKVHVNGERAKAGKFLKTGERVRLRLGAYEHTVVVRELSEHRGSGADAARLYEETPESRSTRERLALQMKSAPTFSYEGKGRPTKKDRRDLAKFKDR
jgi:ribosome-associated heat shock protein Hsp15